MKPVTVGRYRYGQDWPTPPQAESQDWLGWVATDDWCVWQGADGRLYVQAADAVVLPE